LNPVFTRESQLCETKSSLAKAADFKSRVTSVVGDSSPFSSEDNTIILTLYIVR
jgi:hypothetical protein